MAGTTSASAFTKTGTDANTGSVVSAAGTTGTAASGDTLDWVLHYSNDTGAPAQVNITDPSGPNQTYVPGSLQAPPGLSSEWSIDHGTSFTSSEPGSGVNEVGATGQLPNTGLGAVGPFTPITTPTTGNAASGDGWEDIFYNGNVYNLHHHYQVGESSTMTLIDCHVVATGAECPGYSQGGLAGLDASSTAGTPFFSAAGQPATSNFTTMQNNFSSLNTTTGKLYFATTLTGTGTYGIGCLDLANNTSCGFTQLGTGPSAITGPFQGYDAGGVTIGTKYYLMDYTGHVQCYDTSTGSSCGSYAAYPGGLSLSASQSGSWSEVVSWGGRYLITKASTSGGENLLSCVDLQSGSVCSGFPVTDSGASGNSLLLPVMDTSGNLTGVCDEYKATNATSSRVFNCYSVPGATTIANPYPVPANTSIDPWSLGSMATVGTKVYYVDDVGNNAAVGDSMTYQYECYDFATSAPCAGFSSPLQTSNWADGSSSDLRVYTIVPDPALPGCMAEDGDGGIVQYFDAATGALGCTGMQAQVAVNPPAFYCDGSAHATAWSQIMISGIAGTQYAGALYTVFDKNGSPVPGYTNVSIPAGQDSIDISGIPMSGDTSQLSVSMTLTNPATGVTPKLSLTFQGTSGAELCFKTVAGPQTCSADQGLDNQGNAITTGDNGVSDGPNGDDSGYAMFFEPSNPKLSSCRADLSVDKTADGTRILPGGQVMYTLVVQNHGPDTATDALVSDPMPAGLSIVSAQPSQGRCTTAGAVDCSLGTILNGGSAQILVVADVSASAQGSITNCADANAFQNDPHTGNNASCSAIPVVQPPSPAPPTPRPVDVRVVKRVNHSVARLGQALTYTLNVRNNGPGTAPNVGVTDTSMVGMRVLSIKPSQGTCTKSAPVSCKLGALRSGKTATVTIRAIPRQTGSEVNSASTTPGCTSAGSCPADSAPRNNISHARTRVRPYLRLVKTVEHHLVKAGHSVTYHLKVSDPTPVAVKHVRVCDRLPLGLVYVGAHPRARLTNGRECWSYKSLGAHRSRTITAHARALKGTSGRKVNHATATGKGVPTARAKATVRVKHAPKPAPPTPVTG